MAIESKRGCGFRKVGGLYLMGDKGGRPCGRMPLPLEVCPACGEGIKQSRGWTWIDPSKLFKGTECARPLHLAFVDLVLPGRPESCASCPLHNLGEWERAGLLWIGSGFYPTPQHFMEEAKELGISKRISGVPRFRVFKPTRIEKVVTQSQAQDEEEMAKLHKQGITPFVVPDDDPDHQGTVYDKREEKTDE